MKEYYQIIINNNPKVNYISIIEGYGTYGSECDLLEVYGAISTIKNDAEGYLSAEEVFDRIINL